MKISNQAIIQKFLNSIVEIVSQGSSKKYALMVLNRFVQGREKTFPFLKWVHIGFTKIRIDKRIDSVSPEFVGKFLKTLVDELFSHLFVLLVRKKLPESLAKYLEYLGVITK